MIRASRAITLVLIGTAAAAAPVFLATALHPSSDDIEDGGGDFGPGSSYGPTTRSSYGSHSSGSHYHHYWFWGNHSGSGYSYRSGSGSSGSSFSHGGTSRGGFGHTGHSSGS
jgi:hypothetical protein